MSHLLRPCPLSAGDSQPPSEDHRGHLILEGLACGGQGPAQDSLLFQAQLYFEF